MSLRLLLQIQTLTLSFPLSFTLTPCPPCLWPHILIPLLLCFPPAHSPVQWQVPTEQPVWPGCTVGAQPQLGHERTETLQSCPGSPLPRPINKGTLFAFLSSPVQIFTGPATRGGSAAAAIGSSSSLRGHWRRRHLPCSSYGDLQSLHNRGRQ